MNLKVMFLAVPALVAGLSSFAQASRESGGRLAAAAVFINFTSYGTGIDAYGYEFVDERITEANERGEVLEQTSQPWGREGETLRCVQFADANARFRFVSRIAPMILNDEMMNGMKRTSVRVGFSCDNYEHATEQDLEAYMR